MRKITACSRFSDSFSFPTLRWLALSLTIYQAPFLSLSLNFKFKRNHKINLPLKAPIYMESGYHFSTSKAPHVLATNMPQTHWKLLRCFIIVFPKFHSHAGWKQLQLLLLYISKSITWYASAVCWLANSRLRLVSVAIRLNEYELYVSMAISLIGLEKWKCGSLKSSKHNFLNNIEGCFETMEHIISWFSDNLIYLRYSLRKGSHSNINAFRDGISNSSEDILYL